MDESFIDEGEGDPGSMVEPAAAQAKHGVFQELGNFRRIGLLDGLVLFGQQVSTTISKSTEDTQVLEAAAKDPNNCGLKERFVLRVTLLQVADWLTCLAQSEVRERWEGRAKVRTCA